MERHMEAVASYETAISLQRDHISAWNNLALLYENSSRNYVANHLVEREIIRFLRYV